MPPLENTYVCSEHFTEDCFDSLKESLLPNEKLKRRLKLDAVPSVFPHSNPKRPRQSSEKRAERQHRKELTTKISDQVMLPVEFRRSSASSGNDDDDYNDDGETTSSSSMSDIET
ncbi:hypothetical protein QZH41_017045 [Actinostola sp. cb2023]|nr:hypothetical protein QZH41_017045 [Actinostola sp. cb2023]